MTGINHALLDQCSSENVTAGTGTLVMDLSTKSCKIQRSQGASSKEQRCGNRGTDVEVLATKKHRLSPCPQDLSLNSLNLNRPKFFRPWEREPRNCRLCPGKSPFSRKSDLQRHIKTKHSDENLSYHCRLCNEKCTRKDNLTRHLKTIHNVDNEFNTKPNCRFCNKRLSRTDAVKRHEKSCKSESKKSSVIAEAAIEVELS